jgi:hypothetical protein
MTWSGMASIVERRILRIDSSADFGDSGSLAEDWNLGEEGGDGKLYRGGSTSMCNFGLIEKD